MNSKKQTGVLFVCMGNICRSPTAEGVFRSIVTGHGLDDSFIIDSSGTHSYHIGSQPDQRAQMTARSRGLDLSLLRGRQLAQDDFYRFQYILAMDRSNLSDINRIKPSDAVASVYLFLDYAKNFEQSEVPDPYYGGDHGFENVFDMVEDASTGLLDFILQNR